MNIESTLKIENSLKGGSADEIIKIDFEGRADEVKDRKIVFFEGRIFDPIGNGFSGAFWYWGGGCDGGGHNVPK